MSCLAAACLPSTSIGTARFPQVSPCGAGHCAVQVHPTGWLHLTLANDIWRNSISKQGHTRRLCDLHFSTSWERQECPATTGCWGLRQWGYFQQGLGPGTGSPGGNGYTNKSSSEVILPSWYGMVWVCSRRSTSALQCPVLS